MSFRNDLDAANARIETLERERRELAEQNARLTSRLRKPEVDAQPKPWPLMTLFDGLSAMLRGLFSRE